MNTSRKVSTRTVLASGALALSFAIGSAGSAMAGPMAPERTTSFGQSVATHEVGSHVDQHYRTLTADQIAARQQLRTDIVALVSAMRAGDDVAAQAALTKVMSDIKAVKAADAAAAAAKDPKDSRDEQKGDDDSTEAKDPADSQDSKDSTEARPVAGVVKKDRTADPKRCAGDKTDASNTSWKRDGQAHSAAWHNDKSWSSAHDSRDRHDGDHRDRRGHHGSRHGDHHRSGR